MTKLKVFMTIFNRFSWGAKMREKFDAAGLETIIFFKGYDEEFKV